MLDKLCHTKSDLNYESMSKNANRQVRLLNSISKFDCATGRPKTNMMSTALHRGKHQQAASKRDTSNADYADVSKNQD